MGSDCTTQCHQHHACINECVCSHCLSGHRRSLSCVAVEHMLCGIVIPTHDVTLRTHKKKQQRKKVSTNMSVTHNGNSVVCCCECQCSVLCDMTLLMCVLCVMCVFGLCCEWLGNDVLVVLWLDCVVCLLN